MSEKREFALRPVAAHYLRDYLLNPMEDEVLKSSKFDIDKQNSSLAPDAGFRYLHLAELLAIAKSTGNITDPSDTSLLGYLEFSSSARTLYRNAIPIYVQLAFSEAQIHSASTDADKLQLRNARNLAAQRLSALWSEYTNERKKRGETDIRLQMGLLRSQFAVFARAQMYSAASGTDDVPGGSFARPDNLLQQWLQEWIQPRMSDPAFQMISIAATRDFKDREQELIDFENSLRAFFDTIAQDKSAGSDQSLASVWVAAKNSGQAASATGLFVCSSESVVAFECKDSSSITHPALEAVLAQIDASRRPKLEQYSSSLADSTKRRTLPVI